MLASLSGPSVLLKQSSNKCVLKLQKWGQEVHKYLTAAGLCSHICVTQLQWLIFPQRLKRVFCSAEVDLSWAQSGSPPCLHELTGLPSFSPADISSVCGSMIMWLHILPAWQPHHLKSEDDLRSCQRSKRQNQTRTFSPSDGRAETIKSGDFLIFEEDYLCQRISGITSCACGSSQHHI